METIKNLPKLGDKSVTIFKFCDLAHTDFWLSILAIIEGNFTNYRALLALCTLLKLYVPGLWCSKQHLQ